MLLMLLIPLIEKGDCNKEQEMLLMLWSTQSNQKNSKALCRQFSTSFEKKEGKNKNETYQTKIGYKKEIIYEIVYYFGTQLIMYNFRIATVYNFFRFDHFFVDVLCFILLLLLLLFLLFLFLLTLLLMLLMLLLFWLFFFMLFALFLISLLFFWRF